MTNNLLQPLKGFRDFMPQEKWQREYLASKIKSTFIKFGFQPLETPTLEYASLLLGKYGQEADKLVYTFKDQGGRMVGLRYDQTVPTARVVATNKNSLPKYFRRYQIQNVFRAEKPQKGRYRELIQCDADIFGTTSPLTDAEILTLYYSIYKEIGFKDLVIFLNDRETLISNLSKYENKKVSVYSIIQTIDKLDKMPETKILKELISKGLTDKNASQALESIKSALPSPNLEKIMSYCKSLGIPAKNIEFSPTLARGLDYYTGMIFEGKIQSVKGSSVGGGGRYDKLIGEIAGSDPIPAVGFGLGFDRTLEAALELGLIPEMNPGSLALITVFSKDFLNDSLSIANYLRSNNVSCEIYPNYKDNLGKQISYANNTGIPYVVIIADQEKQDNQITLKDLEKGKQYTLTKEKSLKYLKK